ncbi:MAG: hypothetical protein LBB72_02485 [Spirochaetaceae bacterium]|nr:hypothetical protein [Spirochaetaceae bacterium]
MRTHSGHIDICKVTAWLAIRLSSCFAFACSWETYSRSWDATTEELLLD